MTSSKKNLKALVIYIHPKLVEKIDSFVLANREVEEHFHDVAPEVLPTTRAAFTRKLLEDILRDKRPNKYRKDLLRSLANIQKQLIRWKDNCEKPPCKRSRAIPVDPTTQAS